MGGWEVKGDDEESSRGGFFSLKRGEERTPFGGVLFVGVALVFDGVLLAFVGVALMGVLGECFGGEQGILFISNFSFFARGKAICHVRIKVTPGAS